MDFDLKQPCSIRCDLCLQEFIPPLEYSRVPLVLSGADCEGNESALMECAGVQLGSAFERCQLNEVLNVHCFSAAATGAPALTAQVPCSGCAWELAPDVSTGVCLACTECNRVLA